MAASAKKSAAALLSHLKRRVDQLDETTAAIASGGSSRWLLSQADKQIEDLNTRVVDLSLLYKDLGIMVPDEIATFKANTVDISNSVSFAIKKVQDSIAKAESRGVDVPVTHVFDLRNAELLYPKESLAADSSMQVLRD